MTITENGFGKRTALDEYPAKSRATKGVVSIKVSERNGPVVGAVQVEEQDEIMLITDNGTLVRTRVDEVSVIGRNTQGVRIIRTIEGEHVVALQRIDEIEETEVFDATEEGDEASTPSVEGGTADTPEANVEGEHDDSELNNDNDTQE